MELDYDYASDEPDGQLLLEIIRQEEDRDLQLLVTRIRGQCQGYFGKLVEDVTWTEQHERTIVDFLSDSARSTLFVALATSNGALRLELDVCPAHISRPTCFFLKPDRESGALVRPGQFDSAIYSDCMTRGSSELAHHVAKVTYYFERRCFVAMEGRLRELKHLMLSHLLSLRTFITDGRSLSDAVLVKPTLVFEPSSKMDEDEDQIELLERMALQWISVLNYALEMKNYYSIGLDKSHPPTINDEIESLQHKYEVLKKISSKLKKDDYQRVLRTLKRSSSVVGDELEHLLALAQEESKQAKHTAKFLTCLRRSIDAIEKVKIFPEVFRGQQLVPLVDLPAIYQDALNRIIVIAKHVPSYEDREEKAASWLVFMIGNQAVGKISEHAKQVAIDELFLKGRPAHCADDLEQVCRRCIQRCVSTYCQTMRWQNMDLDDTVVLANFRALDLRLGHMMDICAAYEQLAWQGEGLKEITFSAERRRDIGKRLAETQKKFSQMIFDLVTQNRDTIFDIHQAEVWYRAYYKFQHELQTLEIQLVHDFEEAVGCCTTLWNVYEVLLAFKHLYKRSLFTSVINTTANQLFKRAAREAKVACGMSANDPWSTPISTTMTTVSTRLASCAQRARGNVDKIAKLVQLMGWAGSATYREKALLRCQQAHRMLGEAIRREFGEWCERLHVELMYDTNQALQKFAVRRHFQRPDWIQTNLDGVVFQVLQSAESWDRLLFELPPQFISLWNDRTELRNVHGSVSAMCYYFNHMVHELARFDSLAALEGIQKLERAVQPCLSQITWKQLIMIKRVVTAVYLTMDEIVQELVQGVVDLV